MNYLLGLLTYALLAAPGAVGKPLSAPQWRADLAKAKSPPGNVVGRVDGSPFRNGRTTVEYRPVAGVAAATGKPLGGPQLVIDFRHGTEHPAPLKVVVFLGLGKMGEKGPQSVYYEKTTLGNHSTRRTRINGQEAPLKVDGIMLVRSPSIRSIPRMINPDDHAMRLEVHISAGGKARGRIYLCLPDAEKSVIAGDFSSDYQVVDYRTITIKK